MAGETSRSTQFLSTYESLGEDCQLEAASKLIELLDDLPSHLTDKAICSALDAKARYAKMPRLDLRSKKREIDGLVERLSREAKQGLIMSDRSQRDDILSEAVDSLLRWLEDIWRVVYEYETCYERAHDCLLFAADSLVRLCESRGPSCKCPLLNIPVNLTVRRQSGEEVKTFSLMGLPNLDEVLLWVWRELFVSMLGKRARKAKTRIPEMLVDIEDSLTWHALERLSYGGRHSLLDYDYDDDDDDDDGKFTALDDKDHQGHASRRAEGVNNRRITLRGMIREHLMQAFRISPSLHLYLSLKRFEEEFGDDGDITEECFEVLSDVATHSSENLVAALAIYADEGESEAIRPLLEDHAHLLRPRDACVYQGAVDTLMCNEEEVEFGLKIVEQELVDTIQSIHAHLRGCFSGIDVKIHQEELEQILKLRNTSTRHSRIETWVENVATPPSAPANTVQFVAAMMGIPVPPGIGDGDGAGDADPFLYADMDDPDLVDLREEYRPRLKERFEGWVEATSSLTTKESIGVHIRVYKKIIELMPFFRTADIVDAMVEYILDNPNRQFLSEALEYASSFCALQRKTLHMKAKRKAKAKMQASASSSTANHSQPQTSQTPAPQTSSSNGPPRSLDADDSDSPPPLVPVDVPTPPSLPGALPGMPGAFPFPIYLPPFIPGGIEDVD